MQTAVWRRLGAQVSTLIRRYDLLRELRQCRQWLADLPSIVWVVMTVALGVRLAAIGFGLPYQLDVDEQIWIVSAHRMVFEYRPYPGWYGSPASTLFYPLAFLFAIYTAVATIFSWFDSNFVPDLHREAQAFYVIGRSYTAIVGTLVLLATYAVLRYMRVSLPWALFAVGLLAFNHSMLDLSVVTRMDMLQILFMVLAVLFIMKGVTDVSLRMFIVSGIFAGLSVTSKYPGAVLTVTIFVAILFLVLKKEVSLYSGIRWLILSAVACLAAIFLSAPFLFFHFEQMLQQVAYEARDQQVGAMKESIVSAFVFHFNSATVGDLGITVAYLSFAASLYLFFRRIVWLVPFQILIYAMFISLLSLQSHRWMIAVLPFLVISLAFAGHSLTALLSKGPRVFALLGKGILVFIAFYLLVPMVERGAHTIIARAGNLDTRMEALAWARENLPKGSRVLLETFAPHLSSRNFTTLIERDGTIVQWDEISDRPWPPGYFGELARIGEPDLPASQVIEAIDRADVDYILVSNFVDLYRREAQFWPKELEIMELVLSTYPEIKRFKAEGLSRGPTIRVLQRSPGQPTEPQAAD